MHFGKQKTEKAIDKLWSKVRTMVTINRQALYSGINITGIRGTLPRLQTASVSPSSKCGTTTQSAQHSGTLDFLCVLVQIIALNIKQRFKSILSA